MSIQSKRPMHNVQVPVVEQHTRPYKIIDKLQSVGFSRYCRNYLINLLDGFTCISQFNSTYFFQDFFSRICHASFHLRRKKDKHKGNPHFQHNAAYINSSTPPTPVRKTGVKNDKKGQQLG
jgi:hypothetical protein